jgi:hypothetical protein
MVDRDIKIQFEPAMDDEQSVDPPEKAQFIKIEEFSADKHKDFLSKIAIPYFSDLY